jgi:hypothetical protein
MSVTLSSNLTTILNGIAPTANAVATANESGQSVHDLLSLAAAKAIELRQLLDRIIDLHPEADSNLAALQNLRDACGTAGLPL